mmetsp:Transcript_41753/g.130461  ORF Transcript_41753/g.130461 Transcript_41753/m.130461 type:complete len:279 (-) Transcript_41753:72-908(-)
MLVVSAGPLHVVHNLAEPREAGDLVRGDHAKRRPVDQTFANVDVLAPVRGVGGVARRPDLGPSSPHMPEALVDQVVQTARERLAPVYEPHGVVVEDHDGAPDRCDLVHERDLALSAPHAPEDPLGPRPRPLLVQPAVGIVAGQGQQAPVEAGQQALQEAACHAPERRPAAEAPDDIRRSLAARGRQGSLHARAAGRQQPLGEIEGAVWSEGGLLMGGGGAPQSGPPRTAALRPGQSERQVQRRAARMRPRLLSATTPPAASSGGSRERTWWDYPPVAC